MKRRDGSDGCLQNMMVFQPRILLREVAPDLQNGVAETKQRRDSADFTVSRLQHSDDPGDGSMSL